MARRLSAALTRRLPDFCCLDGDRRGREFVEMDDDLIRGVDRLTIGRGAPVGRDEDAYTRVDASTDPRARCDQITSRSRPLAG